MTTRISIDKRLRKNDCCWGWGFPICTDLLVDEALDSGLSLESHLFEYESSVRRPERPTMVSAFYSVVKDTVDHVSTEQNGGTTSDLVKAPNVFGLFIVDA